MNVDLLKSMKKKYIQILVVFWLLFTGASVFWYLHSMTAHRTNLPTIGIVPQFTLTAQDHRTVQTNDLEGKVTIADFIFTSCAGPCPIMSATMSEMQEKIARKRKIQFVSFSVDPETDSPDVLASYAAQYHADPARWTFLTGSKDKIFHLTREGFHLAVEADSNAVTHSTKFILIDKKAVIRGYYDSDEREAVEKLLADADALEGE